MGSYAITIIIWSKVVGQCLISGDCELWWDKVELKILHGSYLCIYIYLAWHETWLIKDSRIKIKSGLLWSRTEWHNDGSVCLTDVSIYLVDSNKFWVYFFFRIWFLFKDRNLAVIKSPAVIKSLYISPMKLRRHAEITKATNLASVGRQ